MKKIFAVLLVIIALVVGFLFYQRQQVSTALRELLKGKTYSSYGIKIEIPPSEGGVKGWLKPYVNIPRVILDLSGWGLETPINLENAVAISKLGAQGGILLEIPRELSPAHRLKIVKPYAELAPSQAILALGVESVSFYTEKGGEEHESQEKIQIKEPVWQLGKFSGVLPDRMEFTWQALEFSKSKKAEETSNRLGLGPLNILLTSEKAGERRDFHFQIRQEPGNGEEKQDHWELGALEFQVQGNLKEVAGEERESLSKKLRSLKYSLTELFHSHEKDSDAFSEALEKPQFSRQFSQFYKDFFQLFLDLDLRVPEADFHWGGVKVAKKNGEPKFILGPWDFQQVSQYGQEDFSSKLQGEIKKLEFFEKGKPIILEGLRYQQTSDYQALNYREIMELYLGGRSIDLFSGDPEVFSDPQKTLKLILNYLVAYPNDMQVLLSLNRLQYETPDWHGEYKDMAVNFQLKPEGLSVEFKNGLDLRRLNSSKKTSEAEENQNSSSSSFPLKQSIEGGQDRLFIAVKFPWEKILDFSRKVAKEEEVSGNLYAELYALLAGENLQGDFDLLLDLGKNYFSFQLDSDSMVPAAEAGSPLLQPDLWTDIPYQEFLKQWSQSLRQSWVEKGSVKIDIQIDRFSKFQKFLDEIKPGTSLALALLAPYIQIDSKADTLKSQLQYKDKQVLVNGKVNDALNKVFAPYLLEEPSHSDGSK